MQWYLTRGACTRQCGSGAARCLGIRDVNADTWVVTTRRKRLLKWKPLDHQVLRLPTFHGATTGACNGRWKRLRECRSHLQTGQALLAMMQLCEGKRLRRVVELVINSE